MKALFLKSNALEVRESETMGGTLWFVVSWLMTRDGEWRGLLRI